MSKKASLPAKPKKSAAEKRAEVVERARHFDSLPDSASVRGPTVDVLFGISPMTRYRWSKSGVLPPPEKRGPRLTTWNVGQLREKLKTKVAA